MAAKNATRYPFKAEVLDSRAPVLFDFTPTGADRCLLQFGEAAETSLLGKPAPEGLNAVVQ
jgi:hypothetical protein